MKSWCEPLIEQQLEPWGNAGMALVFVAIAAIWCAVGFAIGRTRKGK